MIFSLLSVLAGCSWVSVAAQPHFDAPIYAPVDPGSVEILGSYPQRSYVTLGQLHLDATGNAPRSEIRMKLQKAAAKMGADAVVLVADKSMLTGGPVADPQWWNGELNPGSDQSIVGVAIWYPKAAW